MPKALKSSTRVDFAQIMNNDLADEISLTELQDESIRKGNFTRLNFAPT